MSEFRFSPATHSADGKPGARRDSECAAFKPLYAPRVEDGFASTNHDVTDSAALIEEARRRGHEKGLREGRDEAGRMARASLTPSLRTFIDRCRSLASEHKQVEARTRAGVLELASDIAAQILGDTSVSPEQLAELQPTVQATLVEAGRLTLCLHPQDLAQLRDLMREEQLQWPDLPQIAFAPDADLPQGEMRIDTPAARDRLIDEPVTAKLTQILSKSI
jgi:flagellar biosynthesis/type III secretory pathway protein FliH